MDHEPQPAVPAAQAEPTHVTPKARADARYRQPHRLTALSDGVFAIAMTLLALEIKLPEGISPADLDGFVESLGDLFSSLGVFVLAFYVTSEYWIGNHRAMSYVHTVDARALARTISVLVGVAVLPISMRLIIDWGQFPQAFSITAAVLATTSVLAMRLNMHVLKPELADVDPHDRRLLVVQPLVYGVVYALSIPLAFLLYFGFGLSAAWAATFWAVLFVARPVTKRIVARSSG
ncbi:TMEM175 family protein [Pseudonocardia sp. TRM90224]|uniref:TMEM175 family protein n=1 Tax=Pseudonocardia sp. TRM90224 TaxID=2812678 RepID=UPI001E5FA7BE|nr:TMEM175 family protein [Pseudonocardia sp. TRM90224]